MQLETKLPKVGTTIFSVMSQLALEHKAVNLGQGFPDFEPPEALRESIRRAMAEGKNQYAPGVGIAKLREQIAIKTERLYGHRVSPDTEVTVTSGATEALFSAIAAVVRAGDEVIVFDPCYDSYEPAIELQGATAVHLPLTLPAFSIDWQRVREAITPKTRMILINSPHNPSGAVLSRADLDELAGHRAQHIHRGAVRRGVRAHRVRRPGAPERAAPRRTGGAQHRGVLVRQDLSLHGLEGRLRHRAQGADGRVPQGAPVPHVLHVQSGAVGLRGIPRIHAGALPRAAGVLPGQARPLPRA